MGLPYKITPDKRFEVYNAPGVPVWTSMDGKFGIAPDHSTAYGGFSGSAGGGGGWQMRLAWYDCDANVGGPDEGGIAVGYHLYDFNNQNPPGYNYGSTDTVGQQNWGQRGGLGGVLYAGHWYCIETELLLNSLPATGGFNPDGALRAWINGRLVYERPDMVFRTAPTNQFPYLPDQLRPARSLGVRNLLFNWYHGGKTLNSIDRSAFYTGLVLSKEYIGPMNGADGVALT